jgi:beta-xylosidase
MIRHGDYFYAFYAAQGCCGAGCNYVIGIARSKKLLGPWEKYDKNPLMGNVGNWVCPGHGTTIEKDGRFYFLYHAYNKTSHAFTGREGILSEFIFDKDGWIEFLANDSVQVSQAPSSVTDHFDGNTLSDRWQWSVFQPVTKRVAGGELHVNALASQTGAYLGTKVFTTNYKATALLCTNKSSSLAGLGIIGDDKNAITAVFKNNTLQLVQLQDGKETVLLTSKVLAKNKLYLSMDVSNNKEIRFLHSANGRDYITLNDDPVDGSYLPPWDRAVRVGLVAKGSPGQTAVFDSFELRSK